MNSPLVQVRITQKAFTLLELLVVLAIISAMVVLVGVFYRPDMDRDAQYQISQNLRLFLQDKIEQSWLDSVTYGVQVNRQGIQLYQLDEAEEEWVVTDYQWQLDPNAGMVLTLLSPITTIEIEEEDSSSLNLDDKPVINFALMSSGEYSPFSIQIALEKVVDDKTAFILEGDGVNALQILQP